MPTMRQCLLSRQIAGNDVRGRYRTIPSCSSAGRKPKEFVHLEIFVVALAFLLMTSRRLGWHIFDFVSPIGMCYCLWALGRGGDGEGHVMGEGQGEG